MGKKLTKLVYENLENLECNEPIFISFVISILPPVTLALLLFSSTSFSTAILLHFRTTKIFYMLRSTDSQYIILTILLNSICVSALLLQIYTMTFHQYLQLLASKISSLSTLSLSPIPICISSSISNHPGF